MNSVQRHWGEFVFTTQQLERCGNLKQRTGHYSPQGTDWILLSGLSLGGVVNELGKKFPQISLVLNGRTVRGEKVIALGFAEKPTNDTLGSFCVFQAAFASGAEDHKNAATAPRLKTTRRALPKIVGVQNHVCALAVEQALRAVTVAELVKHNFHLEAYSFAGEFLVAPNPLLEMHGS